jgi:hypothetical protein
MLTKLIPEQISNFWDVIKYAVEQSLPPIIGEQPDKMNRILSSMLCGKLDVWASYKKENFTFEAILVTQFLFDEASGVKNLLLYCVYGYIYLEPQTWLDGFDCIMKYAKANKCHSIIAYSSNEYVINLAKKFGGDTSFTFISLPLN